MAPARREEDGGQQMRLPLAVGVRLGLPFAVVRTIAPELLRGPANGERGGASEEGDGVNDASCALRDGF